MHPPGGTVVYSIKLKPEFAVLSKLVNFVDHTDSRDATNVRKTSTDFTGIDLRRSSTVDGVTQISDFSGPQASQDRFHLRFKPDVRLFDITTA
ncbi:hypothetical protein LTR62_004816 [Meristemomyces frigidus]|uniref:Uncharacterized protein n=1 Tax=Meristemomyces frigidus TaxID=1508187 RepID=A0AAN7TDX0_9PEZI|nr:hypothetical protein LTR62_004816 [Meristemomyces frigidus]